MENEYYSWTFYTKSVVNEIYEFDMSSFENNLDCLFHVSYIKSHSNFFKRPMNILVAEQNDFLTLALNFSKAIVYGNIITTIKRLNNLKSVETVLSEAFQEIGMNAEMFIKLPIEPFKRLTERVALIYENCKTINDRNNYLLENDVLKDNDFNVCADAILKSSGSSSIYGGEGMWIDPIFKARNVIVDPNLCFCILPFNDDRLAIFDDIIKPELSEKFGITAIRSGNIFDANLNIIDTIWTYINQASFIIVDISDKNPNVFYELGICHTIGKNVVTLCDKESYKKDYKKQLPFDINVINVIFYENTAPGSKKMLEDIAKTVNAIRSGTHYLES